MTLGATTEDLLEGGAATLARVDLPALLLSAVRSRRSGYLHLERDGRRRTVGYLAGQAMVVTSAVPGESLDEYLMASGALSEQQVDQARALNGASGGLAVAAFELGFLSRSALIDALRAHQSELLDRALAEDGVQAEFRSDATVPPGLVAVPLLAAVEAAMRRYEPAVLETLTESDDQTHFVLDSKESARARALGPSPALIEAMAYFHRPTPLRRLVSDVPGLELATLATLRVAGLIRVDVAVTPLHRKKLRLALKASVSVPGSEPALSRPPAIPAAPQRAWAFLLGGVVLGVLGTVALQSARPAPVSQSWANPMEAHRQAAEAYLQGNALLASGKTDLAVDEYHRSLSLCPDAPEVYRSLGVARAMQNANSEAITAFTAYLDLNGDASDASDVRALIDELSLGLSIDF